MPETVTWSQRTYTLVPFRDGWRIRSRQRGNEIDWQFPACSVAKARDLVLARFEEAAPTRVARGVATLADVAQVYPELPKRASETTAYNNVKIFGSVVKTAAKKPLHRLRGLYADEVARLTQDAVAARLAGVKAAASALGHTNTATTERSYLSP